MALTAPGGISNSSSRPFSNLFGRIAMDNYNILQGSISSYDFNSQSKKKSSFASNKYHNLKPKSVSEVIVSTGLVY